MTERLKFVKNPWVALVGGLLLGALIVLAIRFVSYAPEHTHYHANFAVYINGQREEFKGAQYYQEVAVCSAAHGVTIPQQRAHLHDNINSVIHVHDHAVTWGQFFDNLGWSVGNDFIETDTGTFYRQDDTNKLHVYLNGQDYTGLTNVANTLIKDKDRLLISYGAVDTVTLEAESKSVPSTAARYDVTVDPASCSGDEAVTTKERLQHLF